MQSVHQQVHIFKCKQYVQYGCYNANIQKGKWSDMRNVCLLNSFSIFDSLNCIKLHSTEFVNNECPYFRAIS